MQLAASEDMLLYLLLVNGASFLLMGFDKMTAKLGSSRIPEAWFFILSLAGGFLGVVGGMYALPPQDRQDELPDQDSCCNVSSAANRHLHASSIDLILIPLMKIRQIMERISKQQAT